MTTLRWGLFVCLLLVLAVLVLQFQSANVQLVAVRTLIGDVPPVSLGSALLWSLLLGFAIGLFIGGIFWQIKVLENQWLKRKLQKVQLAPPVMPSAVMPPAAAHSPATVDPVVSLSLDSSAKQEGKQIVSSKSE